MSLTTAQVNTLKSLLASTSPADVIAACTEVATKKDSLTAAMAKMQQMPSGFSPGAFLVTEISTGTLRLAPKDAVVMLAAAMHNGSDAQAWQSAILVIAATAFHLGIKL